MCGIVGVVSRRNVAPLLLEGLKRLEYRGYDSAGIAVIQDDHIECRKVVGRVEKLDPYVENNELNGTIG
ncbi:MAG: glutamine--fructose-6-phosphate aminotransferase, partial [Candidatus Sumerlaeota bacterium]|nr:glutamine--fructose-6-phosphate aminotransferase [Candidatus Sumerlaeota bacterium]